MRIIGGKRGVGKSANIVKMASELEATIIAVSEEQVQNLLKIAQIQNVNILKPVVYTDYKSVSGKVILIDNMDRIISDIFNRNHIFAATIDSDDYVEMRGEPWTEANVSYPPKHIRSLSRVVQAMDNRGRVYENACVVADEKDSDYGTWYNSVTGKEIKNIARWRNKI